MSRKQRVEAVGGFKVPPPVLMHPSRCNPAPYNPRTIKPEKLEGLKADIRRFGFVENMVVQRSSPKYGPMIVVGGHQRLRAMREICIEDNVALPEVPAVMLDLDDRSAKMLNAALNTPRAEFDGKLLGEMLEDIHAERPIAVEEISIMGFEEADVAKFLKLAEPPRLNGEESPTFARSVTLSIVFNDVRERDAVKVKLEERAAAEKRSTGEVVLGLLNRKR